MSAPTPRTDEQINGKPCTRFCVLAGDSLRDALVQSDFARTLERELYAVEVTLASERGDHLRELAAERQKAQALTATLESICEEWGRNHDAPFCAGSNMEKLATAALAATEDAT